MVTSTLLNLLLTKHPEMVIVMLMNNQLDGNADGHEEGEGDGHQDGEGDGYLAQLADEVGQKSKGGTNWW